MFQNERLEQIMEILWREKSVDNQYLSEILNVTPKTIRLDLEKLEKSGLLKRVHGGAVLNKKQPTFFPAPAHRQNHLQEKAIIARKALSMLKPDDVILLDDGSTTLELAKLLGAFPITVLTNDIYIINELMTKPNVRLYVIGGTLKRDGDSYVINGEESIQFIKRHHVGKLFLGASTVSIENGFMIFYYGDRATKRAFMAAADEIICMMDASKFSHTAFTEVAAADEVDTIITTYALSETEAEKYRSMGVKIIFAEE